MDNADKTALVTGANSGLGFEASAQLADDGWGRVILACRSVEKAETARAQLVERTGGDPFAVLAVDTSEAASATAAAAELRERGEQIDFLLLNAGASGKDPSYNSDGVETTYASTLVGHHVLTMGALEHGLLTPNARIVIAGSEGARGNMPGMSVHDIESIADESFGGDRVATIEALTKIEAPGQEKFVNMDEYVTAKLIVAWWAAALSRRLPAGMTVNALSPGANLETSFARDAPAAMRLVMMPAMKLLGPVMGMNGSMDKGARRYLDAAEYTDDDTGHFYATAKRKKLVGPVSVQTWPDHFTDEGAQEAGFDAVISLTGVGIPANPAPQPAAD
jgi:NAD(P)-dependent dehydrogenase (short-subunit alcohol dehydrogenase family)